VKLPEIPPFVLGLLTGLTLVGMAYLWSRGL
jgi:hypothetical protein